MNYSQILKSCLFALLLAIGFQPCLSQKPITEPLKPSKLLNNLQKKSQSIISNIIAKKEVKDKKYEELNKAYNEILTKSPQDEAIAKYYMSLVSQAKKDFVQYANYLLEAEAKLSPSEKYYQLEVNNRLGWLRYTGQGIEKDEFKALDHFEKAYETDSIRAAFSMAMINMIGIGDSPADYISSISLLQQSNHQLRFSLLYSIQYYLNGLENNSITTEAWDNYIEGLILYTVESLSDEAIPYLEKSINLGFIPARKTLADIYFIKRNIDKAIEIITPASELSYPPAVHQHGYYIYTTTIGKLFQYEPMAQVASLWQKGADLGFPNSLWVVGELYTNGYGLAIKKDLNMAYNYLNAAVESGMVEAEPNLNNVKKQINQEMVDAVAFELKKLSTDIAIMDIARKQRAISKQIEMNSSNEISADNDNQNSSTKKTTKRKRTKGSTHNMALIHTYNNWASKIIKMDANPSKYYNEQDLKQAQQEMREIRQMITESGGSCPKSKYESWHP